MASYLQKERFTMHVYTHSGTYKANRRGRTASDRGNTLERSRFRLKSISNRKSKLAKILQTFRKPGSYSSQMGGGAVLCQIATPNGQSATHPRAIHAKPLTHRLSLSRSLSQTHTPTCTHMLLQLQRAAAEMRSDPQPALL